MSSSFSMKSVVTMLNMRSRKRDEREDDISSQKRGAITKAKVKTVAPITIITRQGKAACVDYFRQLSDEMKVQAIRHWTEHNGIDDELWSEMKISVQSALADYRNFLGDQFNEVIDSLQCYGVPLVVTAMAEKAQLTICQIQFLLNAFVLSAFLAKAKILCNEFYLFKLNLDDQKRYANSWQENGVQDDLWSIMKGPVTKTLLDSMPQFKDNIQIVELTLNQARICAPNETVKFEQSRVHEIEPMNIVRKIQ